MGENDNIQSSSISKGSSIKEIADFWDNNSLANHWDDTREVEFEVRAPRRITIEPTVYAQLEEQARTRGVSLATLVNSWLVEQLSTDKAA